MPITNGHTPGSSADLWAASTECIAWRTCLNSWVSGERKSVS